MGRPKLAFTLSLLPGILTFTFGLTGVNYWLSIVQYQLSQNEDTVAISLMLIGGSLQIVSAAFLYMKPKQHAVFGLIICAHLSSSLGMLALGVASPYGGMTHLSITLLITLMVLGMIGGALAIVHEIAE